MYWKRVLHRYQYVLLKTTCTTIVWMGATFKYWSITIISYQIRNRWRTHLFVRRVPPWSTGCCTHHRSGLSNSWFCRNTCCNRQGYRTWKCWRCYRIGSQMISSMLTKENISSLSSPFYFTALLVEFLGHELHLRNVKEMSVVCM